MGAFLTSEIFPHIFSSTSVTHRAVAAFAGLFLCSTLRRWAKEDLEKEKGAGSSLEAAETKVKTEDNKQQVAAVS